MDMQSFVNALSESAAQTRSQYHLTLGQLIDRLKKMDPATEITPALSNPHSYRGYYSDLAFEPDGSRTTAADLLILAQAALDQTFGGYKGGDFIMTDDTPLWFAFYGCCGSAIIDLDAKGCLTLKAAD